MIRLLAHTFKTDFIFTLLITSHLLFRNSLIKIDSLI